MASRPRTQPHLRWLTTVTLMLPIVGCRSPGDPLAEFAVEPDAAEQSEEPEAAAQPPESPSSDSTAEPPPPSSGTGLELAVGWNRLPDAPLEGRTHATVVGLDSRVFVFGGWEWLCPPGSDCSDPTGPPFADGAVFDISTGTWTELTPAPRPFSSSHVATAGSDIYLLAPEPGSLEANIFRYRTADDEWDTLESPGGGFTLATVDNRVIAYRELVVNEGASDYILEIDGSWTLIPDDPMPPTHDRFVVDFDGRLLLFGSSRESSPSTKLVAEYDLATETWTELSSPGTGGYQAWRSGDVVVLNPHFSSAGGGILDPLTDRWSDFPTGPESDSWRGDLAGVVHDDTATYEYPGGWVLDTAEARWLRVPLATDDGLPDDGGIGALGNRLVYFGGQSRQGQEGSLSNQLWVWSPPPG